VRLLQSTFLMVPLLGEKQALLHVKGRKPVWKMGLSLSRVSSIANDFTHVDGRFGPGQAAERLQHA
jgi:hypothetical protein